MTHHKRSDDTLDRFFAIIYVVGFVSIFMFLLHFSPENCMRSTREGIEVRSYYFHQQA